ncbi:MAG: CIA30 family protein [Ignavibacteriae bacterium]|nr:CIA30 family protein [Ignavibacteriota bacterium]
MILLLGVFMSGEKEIIDFNKNGNLNKWNIINDVVMGGVSKASFTLSEEGYASFEGILSPDNNGGFASVRAELDSNGFENFDGVIVRAKGDGNIYSLRFRTNLNWDDISYQAKFNTEENWKEFKIPFDDFTATYRGRTYDNQPKLESNNIRQAGLLISDKQFGNFSMQIDWIKFYKD